MQSDKDLSGVAPLDEAGTNDDATTSVEPIASFPLAAGGRLGRYIVLGPLGHGGMGAVLEAFDRTLDRRVALKVLHRGLDARDRQRLLREAQALAKLSHPHVVQVYEAGEVDGQAFIAMELVRGQTLHAWMRQDPRPTWQACVEVFVQVGGGLAAAHARDLVHRDFKPGNAILDEDGRARVLDFGLARHANPGASTQEAEPIEPREEPTTPGADETSRAAPLTRTGAVLGTPAYMPLEQMQGHEADARSDQFSFCVSLYEAIYGERPFEGDSMMALIVSMTAGQVRPAPKGTTVPAALRRALCRGLAAAPEQRWPTIDALLVELRRIAAPRTKRWLALGLVGGLAVIGVGVSRYAEVGFRCEGARDQLEEIWDDARKQEVQAAILGTDLAYASDTWARIEPRLDDYGEVWVAKHTEVCEDTRVRQAQTDEVMELRMGCLSTRKLELRTAVQLLALANPARVENAVDLVAGLADLSRCDDVEALRAALPPPEDPEVAAQVEAQRERLVETVALHKLGDFAGANAVANAVVERAQTLGYGPLLAEALQARGLCRQSLGQLELADQDTGQAFLLAIQHEHDEVEVQAAAQQLFVVGVLRMQLERAEHLGTVAQALASRTHTDDVMRATVLANLGTLRSVQGRPDDSLVYLEQALALHEQALGPRHPLVANTMGNLALTLLHLGRPAEALERFQDTLSIQEEMLGPRHPLVAQTLGHIGAALGMLGRPDEGLVSLRRALAIQQEVLGPRHTVVGISLGTIGSMLGQQGQFDEALVSERQALAIHEEVVGLRHPLVADSLNVIGSTLAMQGKLDESLASFERALSIHEETLGPRHLALAGPLSSMGLLQLRQGKVTAARATLERALSIHEETLGPDNIETAFSLNNLGDVLLRQGELEPALSLLQRALTIRETSDPRHPFVAYSLCSVGHVLRQLGRLDEAQAHFGRALAVYEAALGPRHPDVAKPLVGLAMVALTNDDATTARGYAERATSIRESTQVAPDDLAEARFVLARALWAEPAERTRARTLAQQARSSYAEHPAGNEASLTELDAWLAEHPGS